MTRTSQPSVWADRFGQARVLVVGDIMLDRYVYGSVSRISPEAPIPVFSRKDSHTILGGAGNVARNLDALGVQNHLITVIGNDRTGARVEELLAELPCTETSIVVESWRTTTMKTRFLTGHQQVLRVDDEMIAELESTTQEDVEAQVEEHLGWCDVVLLSDYGKGVLGAELIQTIIDLARRSGIPVIVDPKGADFSRYFGATVITPNSHELKEATRRTVAGDAEVVSAAEELIRQCELSALLATRGEEGVTLVGADGEVVHNRAEAREVYDVSGAGDTLIAVFAAAISTGASLTEAASLANTAAGIVVGKHGTSVVSTAELSGALAVRELSGALHKVADLDSAERQIRTWRQQGLKIGFTNGIFDLLHAGHVSLLRQAAGRCDRLIVGLNGDESIRRIKEDGPVQTESARSAILGSLEMIDMIVIFQTDTPIELLERFQPEILIKGDNYQDHEVVGADVVRSYGGEVFRAEVSEDPQAASKIASVTNGTF